MRAARTELALLVGIVGAVACGARASDQQVTVIDTVNGIPRVHNPATAKEWILQPNMVTEGKPAGFTDVISLVVDRSGNSYVADLGEAAIKVFDSTGALIRVIGRRGFGPTEFQDLYSIAWMGDTLVAMDPGNSRLELLTPEGAWLGQRRQQRISGRGVVLWRGDHSVFAPGYVAAAGTFQLTAIRHTASGPADTILLPDLDGSQGVGITCEFANNGGISGFEVPFQSRPLVTPTPGGNLVLGWTGEYRLVVTTPAGDTIRVIEGSATPLSVSEGEFQDSLREYRDFRAQNPAAHCAPEDPPVPATKPVLLGLWFDDESRMWVELRDSRGHGYDLLDSLGVLIASVPAPPRDPDILPYVQNGRLYLVTRDWAGVQSLASFEVRLRIAEDEEQ